MKCLILLFAAVAMVAAKEGAKNKRDLFVETHAVPYYAPPAVAYAHHTYAAPAIAYPARTLAYAAPASLVYPRTLTYSAPAYPPYDDGKYVAGKYERPTFYSHVVV